jgi:hypothetical protein
MKNKFIHRFISTFGKFINRFLKKWSFFYSFIQQIDFKIDILSIIDFVHYYYIHTDIHVPEHI